MHGYISVDEIHDALTLPSIDTIERLANSGGARTLDEREIVHDAIAVPQIAALIYNGERPLVTLLYDKGNFGVMNLSTLFAYIVAGVNVIPYDTDVIFN
tara:strand:+ start:192 stop:488 length:297 start_codon:yes stop_codon:yes gene_type:complete